LSGELKHEILEKLSETIYSYKAYPDKEDFEAVATALIQKHPCFTQPSSSKGWNGCASISQKTQPPSRYNVL